MISNHYSTVLNEVAMLHRFFGPMLDTGFLILSRMLGFMIIAPVFGRKDVPVTMKVSVALALTAILIWAFPGQFVKVNLINSDNALWYLLQVFINATVGLFIGFIGEAILNVVSSAGAFMNNQIGLSSAMMFDPGSKQQVALVEQLFSYMGLIVFFSVGGIYWILKAFYRSFEIFPLYSVQADFVGQVKLDYLVTITGNCLLVGLELIAPVMVITMAVDLILGIINRTAQQIQVFQLSFALKPCIGMGVFLLTLPIFIRVLQHYFTDYASIF